MSSIALPLNALSTRIGRVISRSDRNRTRWESKARAAHQRRMAMSYAVTVPDLFLARKTMAELLHHMTGDWLNHISPDEYKKIAHDCHQLHSRVARMLRQYESAGISEMPFYRKFLSDIAQMNERLETITEALQLSVTPDFGDALMLATRELCATAPDAARSAGLGNN